MSKMTPGGCGYPCGYDCNGACLAVAMTPTPPVLRIGTITIIGAAEIAAYRARMQALFGERK